MMSIWHDDKVFPEDKRYWLAFINVRCNGNKFWTVSHHLADFIEDVSGAGFKVCNTKIEKWCYLDDLLNQQAEINRLRETLIRINTLLSENIRPCIFKNATTVSVPIVTLERLTAIIRHSLNREREGKND